MLEIGHHKNQFALRELQTRAGSCSRAQRRTYITLINCHLGLWRCGVTGERSWLTPSISLQCSVNALVVVSIHAASPVAHPDESTGLQLTPLATVCREGAQSRAGSNRGGGNSEHVGAFIHVQRRVITSHMSAVHGAFIPGGKAAKRLLWDHTWKLMKT